MPEKRGRGRPEFVVAKGMRDKVSTDRALGTPLHQIARDLGCSIPTLNRHFKTELSEGLAIVNASLGRRLVAKASAGDVNAIKYWLMTHGGPEWRVVSGTVLNPDPATGVPMAVPTKIEVVFIGSPGADDEDAGEG